MAKITTIIDIGSNSARMAIFKKTSRYGFHLIHEVKSRVRISEGSYANHSYLQDYAMDRAIRALREFKAVSQSFKSRKLICVATSALRDAPNKSEFISLVRKECGINIKVIDGHKEAYFGAVACANLAHKKSGITIDIGGGSTELACIKDGIILDMVSLNLGSIRLKELFFDNNDTHGAYKYASEYIKKNADSIMKFARSLEDINIFGIGGSIRAYAKHEMNIESYQLGFLHGYELNINMLRNRLKGIIESNPKELEEIFDKSRIDSIRPGLLILLAIIDYLEPHSCIVSGVGVREGVFLHDMLRNHHAKIPNNINPSLRALQDIFLTNINDSKNIYKHAKELFNIMNRIYKLDSIYLEYLRVASSLYDLGSNFNFYKGSKHSAYIALNSLNYGFSHSMRYSISILLEFSSKKRPKANSNVCWNLLPDYDTLQILSFIFAVSIALCKGNATFIMENNTLNINVDSKIIYESLLDINPPKLQEQNVFDIRINLD